MMSPKPLTLGFLMFDGFPMACLTSAIEPLRAANEITGTRAFAWVLLAETMAPVRSSADVRFTPDQRLDDAGGIDQIYLCRRPRRSSPIRGTARPCCAGWTAPA